MTKEIATTYREPLGPDRLYRSADPARFGAGTADFAPLTDPLGQPRAVAAIRFAVAMDAPGYNLFALGPEGTGKNSLIRQFLTLRAKDMPTPDDWVYVENFADPHQPTAIRLPPGRAGAFAAAVAELIEDLQAALPAAFQSAQFRQRKKEVDDEFQGRRDRIFKDFQHEAEMAGVAMIRTNDGVALMPMQNGEILGSDAVRKLSEERQGALKDDIERLQRLLAERLQDVPALMRTHRARCQTLERETARGVVEVALGHCGPAWADCPAATRHLQAISAAVQANLPDFLGDGETGAEPPPAVTPRRRGRDGEGLSRFRVNVLITHRPGSGAPVVYQDQPGLPDLVGRSLHLARDGGLYTDFSMIRPGALHEANGGYLLLDAAKLLTSPFAYDALKRALRAGQIRVETPAQMSGLLPAIGLDPDPVPLAVKVVLTGDPMLYYLLAENDPDFVELFKVAADFDYRMDRTPENEDGLARLLAGLVGAEGLRPLDGGALARVIEHASRLAEDGEKLSTHMASIADLVREANHWAGAEGCDAVLAGHVARAVAEGSYRHDRVRAHVLEDITRGVFLIDTAGETVGQVNGLVVVTLGLYQFGHPCRITCRAHLGRGDLIDIEREVQLGGPIHSKGVMILTSFLSARFAQDEPLSLAANLVFEQSYGEVEGDSASSAELYCLLSSLAEVPIRQGFAVTGSVNQYGQVQAIGGVNEKIEGFFDVCKARGLDGRQGVVIPASNVVHLMLREDVVEACRAGLFAIHAVETVDQGIEILTGIPAGAADGGGQYPPGTINRKVAARLAQFTRRARELAQDGGARRPIRDGG